MLIGEDVSVTEVFVLERFLYEKDVAIRDVCMRETLVLERYLYKRGVCIRGMPV